MLITLPLVLALLVTIAAWFVVIVPAQYFVYLIAAAPARFFSNSTRQSIAGLQGGRLHVAEIAHDEPLPQGWWRAGPGNKPVVVTNLFTALLLMLLKWVL